MDTTLINFYATVPGLRLLVGRPTLSHFKTEPQIRLKSPQIAAAPFTITISPIPPLQHTSMSTTVIIGYIWLHQRRQRVHAALCRGCPVLDRVRYVHAHRLRNDTT